MNIGKAFGLQALHFAKYCAKRSACLCLTVGLLASCEKPEPLELIPPPERSDTLLSRALLNSTLQLDPHFVTNVAESALVRDLFVGLTAFDQYGNVIPAVARHSFSEDGKTWLFILDDNAVWSNGEIVSADDFVASWQRLLDPQSASPWANYLVDMQIDNAKEILTKEVPLFELGVRALSHNTLQIELEVPNFQLPAMLAHVALLPSYKGQKPENELISNGAYVLEGIEKQRVTLQARETHTAFQHVIYQRVGEKQSLQGFDLVENPPIDYSNEAFRLPRLCSYFYEFNFSDPVIGQKSVRQAIRSMLVTPEIGKGLGIPLHSILPTTMLEGQDHLPFTGSAESILAQTELDYTNLPPFTLTFGKDELQQLVANRFVRQLTQSDLFRIRLQAMDFAELEELHQQQNFQIMPREICAAYTDPLVFLAQFHSQSMDNHSGYGNEKVDSWLDELQSRPLTQEQRDERIMKIVQQINEDVAILPLFQYQRKIALNPSIIGIHKNNDSGVVYSKDLSRQTKDE